MSDKEQTAPCDYCEKKINTCPAARTNIIELAPHLVSMMQSQQEITKESALNVLNEQLRVIPADGTCRTEVENIADDIKGNS